MKEEWKRFLFQWIIPVGIFGIIIAIMLSVFSANIRKEVISQYHDDVVVSTVKDANAIHSSIDKLESVSEAMLDIISNNTLSGFAATSVLEPMVRRSDAYLAVLVDSNSKATTDFAKSFNASELSYFDTVMNLPHKGILYVGNDEILDNAAIVVKMRIEGDDGKFVLLYYPIASNDIKNVIEVGKSLETPSSCFILDNQGKIIALTSNVAGYELQKDYWAAASAGGNATEAKKAKTKAMSKASSTFELDMAGVQYITAFATIPGTTFVLIENYKMTNAEQLQKKALESHAKRIHLISLFITIFIIVVTIINVSRIFATTRGTDELKDKADRDLLTGLKNKTATEREIKDYIANYPDRLGVMFLVDIDNFKKINDTMGHAFGDEVLRELGKNIGINFRVSDVIGRTGGDEFMIFLKNLKEDANTLREAQKLIYFFRHFQVGDYVKYSVTASIGAAVFPDHGSDFESLYKAADAAVYKSKKRGKNQLSFYDDRDKTAEEVAEADSHLIDISRKEETPIES